MEAVRNSTCSSLSEYCLHLKLPLQKIPESSNSKGVGVHHTTASLSLFHSLSPSLFPHSLFAAPYVPCSGNSIKSNMQQSKFKTRSMTFKYNLNNSAHSEFSEIWSRKKRLDINVWENIWQRGDKYNFNSDSFPFMGFWIEIRPCLSHLWNVGGYGKACYAAHQGTRKRPQLKNLSKCNLSNLDKCNVNATLSALFSEGDVPTLAFKIIPCVYQIKSTFIITFSHGINSPDVCKSLIVTDRL